MSKMMGFLAERTVTKMKEKYAGPRDVVRILDSHVHLMMDMSSITPSRYCPCNFQLKRNLGKFPDASVPPVCAAAVAVSRTIVLNGGNSAHQGTFDNAWRHFWVS